MTKNLIENNNLERYIGDAPNSDDMDKIRINAERALRVQQDYFKWRENQKKHIILRYQDEN